MALRFDGYNADCFVEGRCELPSIAECEWTLDGPPNAPQGKIWGDSLESARSATILALNQLLDLKDLNTAVHSTRLAEWGVRMAEKLGLDENYQCDVEVGGLLHDIGKIGIPDAVLQKPERLTVAEREATRIRRDEKDERNGCVYGVCERRSESWSSARASA
jgi:hypothetical protein